MTLEESEEVVHLNREIKLMKALPDKFVKLHKEGKYEEITNMACELSRVVAGKLESELSKYPSKI